MYVCIYIYIYIHIYMHMYIYIYIYLNMIGNTLRYLWAPPKRNARQEQQPAAGMEEQCLGTVSQPVFRQSAT